MSLRFLISLFCSQQSSLSEEHPDQPGLWSDPLCCLPGKHADFILGTLEESPLKGMRLHEESAEPLSSVSH